MKVTAEQYASHWLVRLEGDVTLGSAAELKTLLLQWLATGKNLELDLDCAHEIDIAALQLFGAAARDAGRSGATITGRATGTVVQAMRDAGFGQMQGFPFQVPNEADVSHG